MMSINQGNLQKTEIQQRSFCIFHIFYSTGHNFKNIKKGGEWEWFRILGHVLVVVVQLILRWDFPDSDQILSFHKNPRDSVYQFSSHVEQFSSLSDSPWPNSYSLVLFPAWLSSRPLLCLDSYLGKSPRAKIHVEKTPVSWPGRAEFISWWWRGQLESYCCLCSRT